MGALMNRHFTDRQPLVESGIESILASFEQFTIQYAIQDSCYGRIRPKEYIIYINPLYNQDGITATHELMHYFFDYQGIMIPERCIESIAQDIYSEHKETIDDYIHTRLQDDTPRLKQVPLTLFSENIYLNYKSVPIRLFYDEVQITKDEYSAYQH